VLLSQNGSNDDISVTHTNDDISVTHTATTPPQNKDTNYNPSTYSKSFVRNSKELLCPIVLKYMSNRRVLCQLLMSLDFWNIILCQFFRSLCLRVVEYFYH